MVQEMTCILLEFILARIHQIDTFIQLMSSYAHTKKLKKITHTQIELTS